MMLSVRVDPALLDEVKDLAHARRLKIQDAVDEMMRSWVRTNGSRR
jgi:mRNA-degrading endonuclease RelE of RelBE toxin-antitoxin system